MHVCCCFSTHVNQKKETDLKNGAILSVNITSPQVNSSFPSTEAVRVQGTTSVGQGIPDVSYIYIIDTSSSTEEYDSAECGSVLNCVQEFFLELNQQVISDGSAELVGVINFDTVATVSAGLVHPQLPSIENAIRDGYSYGWTNCSDALLKAAELVKGPTNKADTTIIVFAGDGDCETEEFLDETPNVRAAADVLANTGAIVHTMAIGDAVDCENSYGYPNDLLIINRNGGRCLSVPDPHTLPNYIDDLIGTSLLSVDIEVDGANRSSIPAANLSAALPRDGSANVTFDTLIHDLEVGPHKVCIRTTGNDTLGGQTQIEDCHDFFVMAPPAEQESAREPWKVFLAVVFMGTAAFALVFGCKRTICKGNDMADPIDDSSPKSVEPSSEKNGADQEDTEEASQNSIV